MKTRILNCRSLIKMALACGLAASLGLAQAADYSATLSGLNPLGYWKLNEGSVSYAVGAATNQGSLGTPGNGAYYFSPDLQQDGALGAGQDKAANFNGASQYIEVPNNAALNPTGPFTVEFWANITNDTAGAKSGVVSRYIPVTGGPAGQRGYLFFANNGNTAWQFRVYNGATAATTITSSSTPDIEPNVWYHVVGVYDGSRIHIYVNGVPTSSDPGIVYAANTNSPLRIGAGTPETAPSLYFPGLLDEVAIYPTALSADQIAAHYDAATTNAAGYGTLVKAANPSAYWRLNEPVLPPTPTTANSGSLGNDYKGSYTFGATAGVAGPRRDAFAGMTATNNAVDLNGTSGMINIPPLAPINTDSVTMTCWIKRNGAQASFAGIMFTRPTATGLSFDGANRLSYTWNDAANTYNFNSGLTVPDGIWTFAALVVTPTYAVLYQGSTNGLVAVTNNVTHTAHDFSAAPLRLGYDNGTRYLKGGIDEAAIFDQALDYGTISNLFFSATPAIPLLTRTPADPLYEGMTVTFTAYGVASGPVNYQWRKAGSNLAGQTGASLVLSNVTTAATGNYDVVATFGANSVTSAVSAITISQGPPVVFTQPLPTTRYAGGTAKFTVNAGGSVPLTYQWQKEGNPIAGATTSILTLTNVSATDAANYRVQLVNPYGTNFSSAVALTVLPVVNYPAVVMADQPMGYWRFNETSGTVAFDYVGGNNGTNQGAVVLGAVGPRPPSQAGFESGNTAFTTDGTTTWVTASPPLFNTNTLTITAWIKVAAYHPTDLAGVVFMRGNGASGIHMLASGELRYHWNGGSYDFASGITVPQGQWVFVALVVEPTRGTLYMNDGSGLVSAVNNNTHAVVTGEDPLYFGRDRTDRVFNGDIDEVALFKRSLSLAEIQNLSLMGVSGPTPPAIVSEPLSQTVFAGDTVNFTAGAIGGLPITYQWKKDGVNIPGATKATLTIGGVDYANQGNYSAGITNAQGFTNTAAASLTVVAPPTFANLTNALVLHLKFDNSVQDSSGRGNHGTIVGAPNYVAGKLGGALHYNTDADNAIYNYVTLGTPADLQFGMDTNFSVAYWVKFTGEPGDLPILGSAVNSYGNFGLTFAPSYGAGGWSFWLGGDMGSTGLYGPADSINDGAWHSLVHTFNRTGNAVTYLDGAVVDTRNISNVGFVDSGFPFNIGQDPSGVYAETASADVDDLGIWHRVLSPTEAQAIYRVGNQFARSFDTYGPVGLQVRPAGNQLELIWEAGTLEAADSVQGPYTTVSGANPPYYKVPATGTGKFYRVKL